MFENWYIFFAVVASVIISHIIKEAVHIWRKGTWDWYVLLWKTGGMPSSHSAAVAALATAVFLREGISTLFWISLVLAVLVIRDAFGVRKSVSDQAKVLNTLMSHAKIKQKVKVVLGHTPFQTVMGGVFGVIVAVLVYFCPIFSF